MRIETKFSGELEIEDRDIINFKQGIPGLEKNKKFIILDVEGKEDLKFLQSIEDKNICLLIINPWSLFKEYEIELSDSERIELEINTPEETTVFNVITIREDKITVNLVAPIIVNVIKKHAKQIILSNTKYNIRQEIACLY